MTKKLENVLFCALAGGLAWPILANAAPEEHRLELVGRAIYWNEESLAYPSSTVRNPKQSDFEQSAIGLQLNYQSPYWAGIIGVDASAYGVVRLGDSGVPTTNLLEVGHNGQLQDSYLTMGIAAIKLKYENYAEARIGRQLQNSLLLKSTNTRALPDTYSGMSALMKPMTGLSVYGAIYDQWRPRSSANFEKFRTETTAAGVANGIDYVGIIGASYIDGPVTVTAEYLNSKSYLSKFGLVAGYTIPIDKNSLKLSSGLFTSRDAGSLFVCGAEKEIDCTGTKRIENDGLGIYLDAELKLNNFTFGGAVAKFDGFWIEDNFAVNGTKTGSLTQDHGSNPFPTSASLGPDLTNNGETVTSFRLAYDWKNLISGLKSGFKYAHGSGAKSSNLANSAKGRENYREIDIKYSMPFAKNLALRYVYLNYDSSISGFTTTATIKGLPRQDWEQHRFYLDYVYQF